MEGDLGRSMELGRVEKMTPNGSEFNKSLFSEYLTLSRKEYNGGDYTDSDFYALRAKTAGENGMVAPTEMAARKLPPQMAPEIGAARGRLVTALGNGSTQRLPRDAAHAQAMFDCWAENAEENRVADQADIQRCKSEFMTALAKIEVVPAPPPPPPIVENYTILFAHNSAVLSADAKRELTRIVDRARAIQAKTVSVAGYADRSGKDDYNMKLSQKRENAVSGALKAAGVTTPIRGSALGEGQPAVQTADGVREEKNRRVTVMISQ
jgi:OOP family OmpA-OmpF porin